MVLRAFGIKNVPWLRNELLHYLGVRLAWLSVTGSGRSRIAARFLEGLDEDPEVVIRHAHLVWQLRPSHGGQITFNYESNSEVL